MDLMTDEQTPGLKDKLRLLDWRKIAQKCMPYVLAVVLASATFLSVLGVQSTNAEYMTIQNSKAEMEAEMASLETGRKELGDALSQTKSLTDQLVSLNADLQALLEKAELEEGEVSDKIQQLEEIFDSVQEQEQQRWVLPMQYKACTSRFGYREHPVAGEGTFHYGVDLGADKGTPIVASRSGTVTTAEFESAAGNYVIIDHLDGYTSRYLHMDSYIVTQGQFVLAGQIIGYCGSTGVSTGNHLHFGIYHNGEPVNPAKFIDI